MSTKTSTTATTEATATAVKTVKHSPCTEAAAKCRLAAIAAIAEDQPFVALAYVQQANSYYEKASDAAADDKKDQRTVATSYRWVLAAKAAAESL